MHMCICINRKKKLFAKIANAWKPLAAFTGSSVLDVWLDSEHVSEIGDYSDASSLFI